MLSITPPSIRVNHVPRHLPNKLEYTFLDCIPVHYQSRMTSNGIAITPSHPPTVQAREGWGGGFVLGVVLCLGGTPSRRRQT